VLSAVKVVIDDQWPAEDAVSRIRMCCAVRGENVAVSVCPVLVLS
jgi:hypothetical protein